MPVCIAIPARMASMRLPNKPLELIGGVPMVVRVVQNIASVKAEHIVVAVDHPDVLMAVESAGYKALMTRDDHPSGSDRIMEVADRLGLADEDTIINIQGDEPMLPTAVVEQLIDLMSRPEVAMATVAEPVELVEDYTNPNIVKLVTDEHGRALYFSRAPVPFIRDVPISELTPTHLRDALVRRHVGIYGFKVASLRDFVDLSKESADALEHIEKLEQLRWLQAGNALHVIDSTVKIPGGVDTPEDLERVRRVFESEI
ncbi:MAG: 3-deoxy-manno-octulosonate cytidylyltransferase [Pseudomonadota bacterium]